MQIIASVMSCTLGTLVLRDLQFNGCGIGALVSCTGLVLEVDGTGLVRQERDLTRSHGVCKDPSFTSELSLIPTFSVLHYLGSFKDFMTWNVASCYGTHHDGTQYRWSGRAGIVRKGCC